MARAQIEGEHAYNSNVLVPSHDRHAHQASSVAAHAVGPTRCAVRGNAAPLFSSSLLSGRRQVQLIRLRYIAIDGLSSPSLPIFHLGPCGSDVISAGPGRLHLHLLLPQARSKSWAVCGKGQEDGHPDTALPPTYTCLTCGHYERVLNEGVTGKCCRCVV